MTTLMNRIKNQCKPRPKVKKCRFDANTRRLEAKIDMPHGENIKGNILSNWYDITDIREFWVKKRHYRVRRPSLFLANLLEQQEAEVEIPEFTEEHKNYVDKQVREQYGLAKKV